MSISFMCSFTDDDIIYGNAYGEVVENFSKILNKLEDERKRLQNLQCQCSDDDSDNCARDSEYDEDEYYEDEDEDEYDDLPEDAINEDLLDLMKASFKTGYISYDQELKEIIECIKHPEFTEKLGGVSTLEAYYNWLVENYGNKPVEESKPEGYNELYDLFIKLFRSNN